MTTIDTNHLRLLRSGKVYHLEQGNELPAITMRSVLTSVVGKAGRQVGKRTVKLAMKDGDRELGKLSLVVFRTEHPPAFLTERAGVLDVRHGCVALFERQGFVLVTTMNFAWSEGLGERAIRRLSRGEMQFYAAHDTLANEVVGIRSLDVLDTAFRSQTTTGQDLSESFPSTGANRSLLTSLGVKKKLTGSTKLGLGTAAIRSAGGRGSCADFATWAADVIDTVQQAITARSTNAFIGMFATPLDIADLPPEVQPSGMLLWLDELSSELDAGRLQLRWRSRRAGKPARIIGIHRIHEYLEASKASMRVLPTGKEKTFRVEAPPLFGVTYIRSYKQRYSLATSWSKRIEVYNPTNQESVSLSSWLHSERCIHLVFTNIEYAYSENTLFRDSKIAGQVERLNDIIFAREKYLKSTKEKGLIRKKQRSWDAGCLFSLVEEELSDATVLICDDMQGEWADYIALKEGNDGPALTFVHCKAQNGDFVPSAFEVVVSQALKNLARRSMNDEEIKERKTRWSGTVGVTLIPRVRKGNSVDDVEQHFKRALARADLRAKIVLAANFLSKSAVENMRTKVLSGRPLDAQETQLAWLLTSFMSHCRRVGVIPEIWCRK